MVLNVNNAVHARKVKKIAPKTLAQAQIVSLIEVSDLWVLGIGYRVTIAYRIQIDTDKVVKA